MGIGFICLEYKFSGCLGWRGDRDGWAVIRSRHRQPETFAKPATDGALAARQHRSKAAMRCLISVGGSRCRSILGFQAALGCCAACCHAVICATTLRRSLSSAKMLRGNTMNWLPNASTTLPCCSPTWVSVVQLYQTSFSFG